MKKIYFHKKILDLLIRYYPKLFWRYLLDYIAIYDKEVTKWTIKR